MSGDEIVVMLASGLVAGVAWLPWYTGPLRVHPFRRAPGRGLCAAAVLVAALVLAVVLQFAAAHDVRDDPRYLTLYFLLGAAWVGAAAAALPVVGISRRDDVLERGNQAAAVVVAGAIVAFTLCFAGANVGDGPGWWVVVFSAALSTGSLFLIWLILDMLAPVADSVTIERDLASALRLSGFVIACAIVFGRAAAGDWVSASQTVRDFVIVAAPIVPLALVAAIAERVLRPKPAQPLPSTVLSGVLPALFYVAVALLHVVTVGWPA